MLSWCVHNSNVTIVNDTYRSIVYGLNKPTDNWWGPHSSKYGEAGLGERRGFHGLTMVFRLGYITPSAGSAELDCIWGSKHTLGVLYDLRLSIGQFVFMFDFHFIVEIFGYPCKY